MSKPSEYLWVIPALLFVGFLTIVVVFSMSLECTDVKKSRGKVIAKEWQPASAGGFGHHTIRSSWFYVTDRDYNFNSTKVHEVGEDIITTKSVCK